MKYPNLKDCWIILQIDNVPAQIRLPESQWEKHWFGIEHDLGLNYSEEILKFCEDEVRNFRSKNDLEDLDSDIWCACADGQNLKIKISTELDNLLNFIFDNCLGNDPEN